MVAFLRDKLFGKSKPPATKTSALQNDGFVIRQDQDFDRFVVGIVGIPRSGTSMTAGCLATLGIPMGDKLDRAVYEDFAVSALIEKGDMAAITEFANAQSETHLVWGWKLPMGYQRLDLLAEAIPQMKLIAMYRDPLAITERNRISMDMETEKTLRWAAEETVAFTDAVLKYPGPTALVSYEKALLDPEGFIDRLLGYLRCPVDHETRQAAAATIENGNAEYVMSSRPRQIDGYLDAIKGNRINGWAFDPERKLEVDVFVNGRTITRLTADSYRADLARNGKGDGHCAFEYSFEFPISVKDDVRVAVDGEVLPLLRDERR
ncbi:MAG: sulfotransferase [Alphaproteobacteria bacterium]|nr:sulfotransferase [Alphaproteobacteria bacterium SS10]